MEAVAIRLRPLVEPAGLKLNRASVNNFENGRIPSWPVLAAIARVYGASLPDVLLHLAHSLKFEGSTDLIRHSVTVSSQPHHLGEATDAVAATNRIQELEGRITAYEAIIKKAHTLGRELVAATGDRIKSRATSTTQRQRRRRH